MFATARVSTRWEMVDLPTPTNRSASGLDPSAGVSQAGGGNVRVKVLIVQARLSHFDETGPRSRSICIDKALVFYLASYIFVVFVVLILSAASSYGT